MDNIQEHHSSFQEIVKKYNLDSEEKASEVAEYVLKHKEIDLKEFSKIFAMTQKDAKIFLGFIIKGIEFKEKHLDGN